MVITVVTAVVVVVTVVTLPVVFESVEVVELVVDLKKARPRAWSCKSKYNRLESRQFQSRV
jgi:hypothetical protein